MDKESADKRRYEKNLTISKVLTFKGAWRIALNLYADLKRLLNLMEKDYRGSK